MGRGLSDLQKQILTRAYENHVREDLPAPAYDVYAKTTFDVPGNEPEPTPEQAAQHDAAETLAKQTARDDICARLQPVCGEVRYWKWPTAPGDIVAIVAKRTSKTDAEQLAAAISDAGMTADIVRSGARRVCRVSIDDDPGDTDLRTLVPEAFADPWPDGYWLPSARRAYLYVGRFETSAEAIALAEELRHRGVNARADPPWSDGDRLPWDIGFAEAMVAFFGCAYEGTYGEVPPGFPNAVIERRIGVRRINRAAIGPARYTAAAVSISRAFDRLEARGLVEKMGYWAGTRWRDVSIALTDAGIETAIDLLANTRYNITSVSQYGDTEQAA